MIERNPPPGGGFLFTMFPHQEPGRRGLPSKNLYQVLRGGSSSSGFLMREHSKRETLSEGGGCCDQSAYSEAKGLELSNAPSVEGRHLPAVEQSAWSEAKALQWSQGTRVQRSA